MAECLLQNRRVLIVEDEFIVAEAMERTLRRAGAVVLGPVPSVDQALALLDREDRIDSAILDINLGGQKVYPVVDRLLAGGTRCVFATGNDPADVPAGYRHVARLEKPVDPASMVEAITASGRMDDPAAVPDRRVAALAAMREQLLVQVDVADALELTLLAVKLYETVDAIDMALEG